MGKKGHQPLAHPILRLRLRVCSPSTSKAEIFSLLRCRPEAVQSSLRTTTPKPSLGYRCSALLWCGQTQMPETPRVYPGVSSTIGIVFSLELQGSATTPNANTHQPSYPKRCLEADLYQYGHYPSKWVICIGNRTRQPKVRHPGVEPGPPRWQREIITARLMTLLMYDTCRTRTYAGITQ